MITQDYIDSKKIVDFYLEKVRKSDKKEHKFAEQFANLHVLKFRLKSTLESLQAYSIKVTNG